MRDESKTVFGSIPSRLLWNLENNNGGLFIDAELMESFPDQRTRLMIILADIEIECGNYKEAERKFHWLISHPVIRANKEQVAYCAFALANVKTVLFKQKEAGQFLGMFLPGQPLSDTKTTSKALLYWGCCGQGANSNDFEYKCFEYIASRYPNSREADQALFYLAEPFFMLERYDEAVPRLQKYLKEYPRGMFCEPARAYLDKSVSHIKKANQMKH